MMTYYLTPRAGRYPFCRECPARQYCLGEKKPEDAETEEWISEVCHETAGEWSLTYGRIDEDDPSFNTPEPPEPWDEYTPDDGDDWDDEDYTEGEREADFKDYMEVADPGVYGRWF